MFSEDRQCAFPRVRAHCNKAAQGWHHVLLHFAVSSKGKQKIHLERGIPEFVGIEILTYIAASRSATPKGISPNQVVGQARAPGAGRGQRGNATQNTAQRGNAPARRGGFQQQVRQAPPLQRNYGSFLTISE